MPDESLRFLWEEGERRVREAPPEQRAGMEVVVDRAVQELRRRLGGPYTLTELEDLYREGTDWVLELAMESLPDQPAAWDGQVLAGAAFARYARGAASPGR
jgi:hypothetical protein